MKNELLVRAISEIDPDLIEEAAAVKPAAKFSYRKLASIAASFVLIITAFIVFAGLPGNSYVSIYGTELSSGASVFNAELTPSIARYSAEETVVTVMIPLEISARGKTTVKTEDENGYAEMLDEAGNILKCGNAFEITENTSFIWYINVSESDSEKKLNIIRENSTETVTVKYDFSTNTFTAVFSE